MVQSVPVVFYCRMVLVTFRIKNLVCRVLPCV